MTNALVYISPSDPADRWRDALIPALPEVDFSNDFHVWPDCLSELDKLGDIDIALVWKPKPGSLNHFPNLKAVINLGAGVDAVLADKTYPKNIPLIRLIDPTLTRHMSEFVVHRVLHFHRKFHIYDQMQRNHNWQELDQEDTLQKRVGIMGLGTLGSDAANHLAPFGFKIASWSRTKKHVKDIESFYGKNSLEDFLKRTDILICLLPLTAETQGIINKKTLYQLPIGAYVINPGRGRLINQDDLLVALDSGHIAGVALDVFYTEPLPTNSLIWDHPKIIVTPHIASITSARSAAEQIAENIRRIRRSEKPDNLVDLNSGY